MTFDIRINDEQRKILIAALDAFPSCNESECELLRDMLEAANTGTLNDFTA